MRESSSTPIAYLPRALPQGSTARLAAELRGEEVAQAIQLDMVYAPEPPFNSGTPETAPPAIIEKAKLSYRKITAQREATARRIAAFVRLAGPV
jgi:cyclohexyl-isocyanide hydratase